MVGGAPPIVESKGTVGATLGFQADGALLGAPGSELSLQGEAARGAAKSRGRDGIATSCAAVACALAVLTVTALDI